MERKLVERLYKYGTFGKFIRATGKETDRRLKYWAPIYFQAPKEKFKKVCVCTHDLSKHRWILGKSKWSIDILECLKKRCRCGMGTQDNFKYIENLKNG